MALSHAVPCLFLGVLGIQFLDWLTRSPWLEAHLLQGVRYSALVLFNVFIVGAVVRLYQLFLRRIDGYVGFYGQPLSGAQQAGCVAVGSLFGGMGVALLLSEWGVLALTLVALVVAVLLWRFFSQTIMHMLRPKQYATWRDVQKLMSIYVTLIICFSLINASLDMLHKQLQLKDAFAHPPSTAPAVFDAFYFTVVVVTTLGFGDIHPMTVDAKLLVILESISSTVMFALIVGVATRGVVTRREQQGQDNR